MIRPLLAALSFLALPAAALASGDAAHHEPQWSLTLWAFANFAIYSYLMKRFAWPAIKEYLQDRRDGVLKALEAAARAREQAEQLKAEFELRMQKLQSEAEKARTEILELAQAEASRLIEQAEKTAELIRKDAQLVADQEVARARRSLQEESAELVTRLATEMISTQVTPQDQERFVKEFLSDSREAAR